MQKLISVRYFCLLILSALLISGCATGWMQQRFDYLNKVAAKAQAETDTIKRHADLLFAAGNEPAVTMQTDSATVCSGNVQTATIKDIVSFSRNETARIMNSHPKLTHKFRQDSSMASLEQGNSIFLFLLLLFGSLILFGALLFWAIGKQMGCLAAAIAVIGLLFEIFLFIFVLDSMV